MNEELILEFKNAIRDLLQIPDVSILNCKEDEKQFNQKIIPNQVSEIQNIINLISPYIDVFKIYVNLNICNCSAVVDVLSKNQVIVTAGWEEDTSLTYDLPYPDAEADIYNISQKLRLNTTLQTDDLYNALFDMENRGFNIVCSIFIILDKINLLKRLDLPAGINCVLYVYDEKFLDTLKNKGIRKLDEIFVLDNVYILLVLLGNTKGYCEGKYLKILGLDYWNDVNIIRVPEDNQNYVDNILKFRNDECQWEFPMQSITPNHFHIDKYSLNNNSLVTYFSYMCNCYCLLFLCNHAKYVPNNLSCEFWGSKNGIIEIGEFNEQRYLPKYSLYKLFAWTYDGYSSDKLGLLRQIISLQLNDTPFNNIDIILMESENILNLAKRNYQYYLKKNIETYFDKRIKLGEYVQKYSENLRGIINSLSLGFINDLYKTVGVVLGAIIAALLAKDNTIFVIRLTSLLYFIYLVFVLLLTILSTIYQYSLKNQDYQNDLANLKAIMLKDEIDSLSKHAINRWKIYFSIVSIFVFSAYFILGYLAIKIFLLMS